MNRLLRFACFALLSARLLPASPVPQELGLTPDGYRPLSQIAHLRAGQALRGSAQGLTIVDANQLVVFRFAPLTMPRLASGWIADAFWQIPSGDSVSAFRTTWKVPAAPATQSGQTIFYFNGICDAGKDTILQPVLQWGASAAGGGNYWSIASWYVSSSGAAHTDLITVNPGDTLVGVMKLTQHSGTQFSYTSEFDGISGTSLPAQNIGELVWNNETLEAYSVTQCSDYPSDPVAFTSIGIDTTAATSQVDWQAENRQTDCGQHATVVNGEEVDVATH
jgi:hypothetical protein